MLVILILFQRMLIGYEEAQGAIDRRKNCERAFNFMKNRQGLELVRVRFQHALMGRVRFTMIASLLVEITGCAV
ncbi:MAG: hypothetical protein CSA33_05085 [Desulfobulbus propionicus]|nr:MAG: hypothetical protein CSA33_05085 [Desulfobulbus propionicus]